MGLRGEDAVARRVMALLFIVEVLATAADLLLGSGSVVHPEERFNARAGVQLACGHFEALAALQYRPWCGGCSVEALMAAPLFIVFGPTVFVWKLVPASFHVALVYLGMRLATRLGGPRAAIVFLVLMLGAPPAFRELSLIGWGNHLESMIFPFAAALLALRGRRGGLVGAGMAMGLGTWFCTTSIHALPAIVFLAGRRWAWVVPGLALGALPMLGDWHPPPAGLQIADTADWGRWLVGEYARGAWWGEQGAVTADLWWWSLLVLAIWSTRRHALVAVAIGTFLAFTLIRADMWSENIDDWQLRAFHLRYRAVLLPWLMLGAALATRRRLPLFLALSLAVGGVVVRVSDWSGLNTTVLDRLIYEPDDAPDYTVPEDATRDWLEHTDRFPECRVHHILEMGSRIGEPINDPALSEWLREPDRCEALGEAWIERTSAWGRRRPTALGPVPERCGPGLWFGVGRGWARWVGCSSVDREGLEALVGRRSRAGLAAGCAIYRRR